VIFQHPCGCLPSSETYWPLKVKAIHVSKSALPINQRRCVIRYKNVTLKVKAFSVSYSPTFERALLLPEVLQASPARPSDNISIKIK
jgi:hypothetical protein